MAVSASQFNDKPEGVGGGEAQQSAPEMPKHRCLLVELLGSFLPRKANEVAFRLVVKLAEGLADGRIRWQARRSIAAIQTFPAEP